jgi:V-type H+-transporting ATPase subunit E
MAKRSDLLKDLIASADDKLKIFANPQNKDYANLLKKLVLQGMVKLLEPVLKIRVRLQDRDTVQKFFPELEKEYSELMTKETTRDYVTKLELDNKNLENER